jgi:invasion protein IalB
MLHIDNKKWSQTMFETCVKQLVTITLNKSVTTEFYNGTLFIRTITEDQARSVFHALSKSLGLGKVQISPIGDTGEFAYDFV